MAENDEIKHLVVDETVYETNLTKKYTQRKPWVPSDPKKIIAVIPGTVSKLYVKEGQTIEEGSSLLILVAMKMENHIISFLSGKIKKIAVQEGQMVAKGQLLIEME